MTEKKRTQHMADLEASIAILADGKLDKRDPIALVTLLGALAGIGAAVASALQLAGVL